MKHAGNFEFAPCWHRAKGRGFAFGGCQRHAITCLNAKLKRHLAANQNAIFIAKPVDISFIKRVPKRFANSQIRPANAAHHRANADPVLGCHDLPFDLRRDRNHIRHIGDFQGKLVKIGNAACLF